MQINYCQSCGTKLPSTGVLTPNDAGLCEKCLHARAATVPPSQIPTKQMSRKSSAARLPALRNPDAGSERSARRSPISGSRVPSNISGSDQPSTTASQKAFGKTGPGVGTGFYFCEKCGKRVTDADLAAGRARNKQVKGIYCEYCAEGALTVSFDAITMPEILKEKNERKPDRRAASSRIAAVKTTHEVLPQQRSSPRTADGRYMLLIGAIGTVVVLTAAVALLRRSDGTDASKPVENIAKNTAPATKATIEIRPEAKPAIENTLPASTRISEIARFDAVKAADTYDPRESRAQSMLDQAQKAFASAPRNMGVYRESLKTIVDGYGSTLAGREAANLLKTMDADTPPVPPVVAQRTPDVELPASKASTVEIKPAVYAVWLKSFHGHWAKRDWSGARQSAAAAIKNPELESFISMLKADQECIGLAQMAEQTTAKGAALLLDARPFVLESVKKKDRFEIGKLAKIIKVDANAITIEQDIGGGKITFNLQLADLTRDTSFALARIAIADDGKGKLGLTLLRFADWLKSGLEKSDSKFDELLEETRKSQPPTELFSRLQAWLAQYDREKRAAAALAGVERAIAGGKAGEATEALAKFTADFAETAFIIENTDAVQDFEKRILALKLRPGLLAKYFSGEIENHRLKYHFSRPITSLEHDFRTDSPAPGVPNDKYDVELTGILRVKDAGEYTFYFSGDDFLEVWLDDKLVGKAQWDRSVTVKIELLAGDHTFKAVHSDNVAAANFKIRWKRPGQKDESIPMGVLFHVPDDSRGQNPK